MRKNLSLFAVLCSSLLIAACNDDTVGPGSGTEHCTASDDCENGMCVDGRCVTDEQAEKCATVQCKLDEYCNREGICVKDEDKPNPPKGCADGKVEFKGECVDSSLVCGEVVCEPDVEACVNGECVPRRLCGEVYCEAGESCHLGQCHAAGECGGLTCLDGETCVNAVCHKGGDCGGVECIGEETCHNDSCRPMGDCGSIQCADNEYCLYDVCVLKEACGDSYCEGDEACVGDVCEKQPFCIESKVKTERCGDACCGQTQFCGNKMECCEKSKACGRDCCGDGEVCEGEVCHKACEFNRCAKADGTEMCCAEGEVCSSNQCFKPSVSCIDNYTCDNDQYCDSAEHLCLPKPVGEKCMSTPKGGEVKPTLVWYWGDGALAPTADQYPNHVQVMSAPMVADVDGDGSAEVIFNSFSGSGYNGNGILRIVDGKTGKLKAFSDPNKGAPYTDGGSQTAVGDIIPSKPGLEILTCTKFGNYYKLAVFNNKAELIWQNQVGNYNECGQSGPGIADFNGDGQPEVYGRYNVLDGKTGAIIAREECKTCNEGSFQHVLNDYPVAADINEDGIQELVGGNVAYKVDFANKKLVPIYFREDLKDGYPAIGDLDLDGHAEIAVVQPSGTPSIMVLNHDGTDNKEWGGKPIAHVYEGGGTPTIANVDGDENPEITFAGRYAYMVFDYNGKMKWYRRTQDKSSAKTGSSVFDFDGDGTADVVYSDEYFLRVYDGNTGETKFCQCNTSGTHWEYPVIADVDGDDHAEIIVSSNNSMINSCPTTLSEDLGYDSCVDKIMKSTNAADRAGTHGVRVFSSPTRDWVNTRKIYNQHAYSVTNVSDNGSIPKQPKKNWATQGLNNFRLNVQPGANYLPDLEIREVSSQFTCPDPTPLYFRVQNVGWATALAGVPINIFAANAADGAYKKLGTVKTTKNLRSGEGEAVSFDIPASEMAVTPLYIQMKFGDAAPEECRSDNNTTDYVLECYKPVY